MKLNLPSTLTKQKMQSLFLLTLLNFLSVQGGFQFRACLDETHSHKLVDMYNSFKSFASKIPNKEIFCCDLNLQCSIMLPKCPYSPPSVWFQCNRVSQSLFCASYGVSSLPGGVCGGILGDVPAVNEVVGICPNLEAVRGTLTDQRTTPAFSWLCCNKENCRVPVNVKIKDVGLVDEVQWAKTDCATDQHSLMCFNDNGGWTCTGNLDPTINIWPDPIGSCLLQVVLPNSNPIETTTYTSGGKTITSVITKTTNNSPASPIIILPQDPHLAEKIVIPVGTVVGVVTIGGITYLIYKKYKKGKNKILLISGSRENKNIEEIELTPPIKKLLNLPIQDSNSGQKDDELIQLIQQTKNKVGSNLEIALETLLDTQTEITKGDNTYALRQNLREAKEKLQVKLSLDEINNLCQLKSEIIQSQLQQEQDYQTQIEQLPYGIPGSSKQ